MSRDDFDIPDITICFFFVLILVRDYIGLGCNFGYI